MIYSNQEIKPILVTENTPEKSLKMSKFDRGYQEMPQMISSPSEIRSQESII